MRVVEFWSSVENASFQAGLVRALRNCGWDARHLFEVSQEDYWNARSFLSRLRLRFRTYCVYPVRLFLHFSRRRGGGIAVVCTNTFFAPWVAMLAAGRNGWPIVHWVFDLFPDVLIESGAIREYSLSGRATRGLVRATFHRAAANVFLGSRLLGYAEAKFGPVPRSVVIPIGCDSEPFQGPGPREPAPASPVRIMYCGNLGRMHDTETVSAALVAGLPAGITMRFCGNGPGFRQLEASAKSLGFCRAVQFGPNLGEADWVCAMGLSDVGLVTMKRGAEGVIMPSKTYSAMAAGQAILAICPSGSDLAETVRRYECGWTIEPGDSEGVARALGEMASDPAELIRRRRNAWRAGHESLGQGSLVAAWESLLCSMPGQPREP